MLGMLFNSLTYLMQIHADLDGYYNRIFGEPEIRVY